MSMAGGRFSSLLLSFLAALVFIFALGFAGSALALGFAGSALALGFAGTSALAVLQGRPLPRFAGGEVSSASELARFQVEFTASTDASVMVSGAAKGDEWPWNCSRDMYSAGGGTMYGP
ncbi:hypothetical protein DFH08DRAFT_827037 [Mycena albidolilacea]|uniref:Uncharacterized protein n=1 Tax=Mycena albidolilacea TaxID=1033008 RepID=A0AAD6YZ27_9AGAR|nr:hypothetical protein DFH08DRAFT_827037 [Mycena albidolilacea]